MKRLLSMLVLVCVPAFGQVSLTPFSKAQWFTNTGLPNAGGCLFTYVSGTTTPLATYTDYTGNFTNSNPVILDSAGRADVWLLPQSYTLVMYTAGGTNCSTGTLLWSENGQNSSVTSLLALNNTWTGTNTWTNTATFNAITIFNAGFTANGPANLLLGGQLAGSFSGSPTFSGMPNFAGGFNATTGTFSGVITSTVAPTGSTPPFVVASNDLVANLNVSQLEGLTWEVPGMIGSTSPNSGVFTTLQATSLQLGSSTAQTGVEGTDTNLMSAGVVSGAGNPLCTDAQLGATTVCPTSAKTQGLIITSGICTTPSGGELSCTMGPFTWATAFTDSLYALTCMATAPSGTGSHPSVTIYWTSKSPSGFGLQMNSGSNSAAGANSVTEIDCIGSHP